MILEHLSIQQLETLKSTIVQLATQPSNPDIEQQPLSEATIARLFGLTPAFVNKVLKEDKYGTHPPNQHDLSETEMRPPAKTQSEFNNWRRPRLEPMYQFAA